MNTLNNNLTALIFSSYNALLYRQLLLVFSQIGKTVSHWDTFGIVPKFKYLIYSKI